MTISLLHPSKIEAKALSVLLNNAGFDVRHHPPDLSMSPSGSPSTTVCLIDTRILYFQESKDLQRLCHAQYPVALLGKLNDFYWYFEFHCNSIGFISKEDNLDALLNGLTQLSQKTPYVSKSVLAFLVKRKFRQHKEMLHQDLKGYLTKTELEMMLEISRGRKTKQIAKNRCRSHYTISNHRKNIIEKLHLNGTFSLNKYCLKHQREIRTLLALQKNKERVHKILKNNHR